MHVVPLHPEAARDQTHPQAQEGRRAAIQLVSLETVRPVHRLQPRPGRQPAGAAAAPGRDPRTPHHHGGQPPLLQSATAGGRAEHRVAHQQADLSPPTVHPRETAPAGRPQTTPFTPRPRKQPGAPVHGVPQGHQVLAAGHHPDQPLPGGRAYPQPLVQQQQQRERGWG